jgi:hypothetical protein
MSMIDGSDALSKTSTIYIDGDKGTYGMVHNFPSLFIIRQKHCKSYIAMLTSNKLAVTLR